MDVIFDHQSPKANVQFSSSIHDAADHEAWGFRDYTLLFEPKKQCAVLFTECNFKGYSVEFCQGSKDFRQDSIPSTFKSVKVPPNT